MTDEFYRLELVCRVLAIINNSSFVFNTVFYQCHEIEEDQC